ncbi:RepB family plasmid replication initiator protein [Burkholderia pseudomallei]|nr:putative plasmid replication protein [Burkholderia mallei ATCC 23344]ABA51342.1 plasmid replication protein, putative [Burkholderia pseudomallei 1710b]AUG25665.1 replication initiation protein [Burkholderia pseudomallei]EBA44749.1 putative replication protein [Burkholderia pseudomallei 305]EDU06858.1 replication protein [Burkholderia pseudomallei 1655]EEP83301.1 replication protein [Burkholderia mallei GB8 horse 4]EES22791.1 putative replication protein [Burkholderia pseudomallei 1106b]EE
MVSMPFWTHITTEAILPETSPPTRRMATKRAKKTDVDVVSASSAELRKAVEAIAIQPKNGKITLLTRKLFNVLLAVAQQADDSGDTYRALLSDIVANSAFDSNDTALVKEHLRRMVSVQVEWSTGTSSQKPGRKWGISTLIADAEILEDPATRRVWVEFSFAPKIKKKLLDPVQYARLSLQFQSQLRSSAGLALYEICVRYLTNPSHLTMREPWEWWRPILSGTPDTEAGDEAKREYKYFKRDYLRPAIAEVNAVTNIFVELVEHREGRRVAEIQFRVSERKQPMLALDEHPNVFDSTLVDRMVKIGIPLKEAQTLYADNEENRIRAALQLTEQRVRSTTLPPVRSAPALFKDALKKGYAPPVDTVEAPPLGGSAKLAAAAANVGQADDPKARLRSEYDAYRRKEAKQLYEEQGDAEREVARASFESDVLPALGSHLRDDWRRRGLDSKLVETAFFDWLAQRTWGEPTDGDLLAFTLSQSRAA